MKLVEKSCLKRRIIQLNHSSAHLGGFFVWFLSLHQTQVFRRTANKIRVTCKETSTTEATAILF